MHLPQGTWGPDRAEARAAEQPVRGEGGVGGVVAKEGGAGRS